MSKNTGQTTKINTHLVNFGQPYQGGPSNILMNKQKTEHDNIVKESETKTDNLSTQTQPMQHF